ncbi:MAG TPA: alpha/beta hydrolase [Gemmataceae bacterium]|nr:alpha/beta hydrolase [Gemmataceae bacterium]
MLSVSKEYPMIHRFGLALVCGLLFLPSTLRAEEGSFDSNGVKIHYVVEGKGEPVLLIHGFAVNAQWQWGLPGIIKALAKDHRVIALDCRGHGKSGKPTDPKKYGTEMVEDAVRLLDHLKIKKAHVVGYSMGAIITGKLLATHPDRLLSATLGGAGAIRKGTELPPFIGELADSLEQGKGMGPLIIVLTPPDKPKPTPEVIQQINRMVVGDNGKALAAVVRGWKALAVTDEQLKANKVPVLALIGANDPLKKSVDDLKDRMKNLHVVVIDKADHITAFVNPNFIKSLSQFLDEHRQRQKVPAGKAGVSASGSSR